MSQAVYWTPRRDGDDRLESWKEIAAYLGREVRTIQLWEKSEGLPLHSPTRLTGDLMKTTYQSGKRE